MIVESLAGFPGCFRASKGLGLDHDLGLNWGWVSAGSDSCDMQTVHGWGGANWSKYCSCSCLRSPGAP